MKVPTDATKVFKPATRTGTGGELAVTGVGFPPDWLFNVNPSATGSTARYVYDRLRGAGQTDLRTNSGSLEGGSGAVGVNSFDMDGFTISASGTFLNVLSTSYINYFFRRAPLFMDTVCYVGTGSATTQAHNLGAAPELMFVKKRSASTAGSVYSVTLGNTKQLELFSATGDSAAFVDTTQWNSTTPTSSVFTLGTNDGVNGSGSTYVAYLFATCAGVSKCFSYTGNGSSQTINCGFTGGARWIMIKRTDSTGDWYVWDTARGIVAGNDPHLSLNSTAAEVTSNDTIDTDSTGFIVNQVSATNVNVSSATYIGLAIA
jgi:hypothetical protein